MFWRLQPLRTYLWQFSVFFVVTILLVSLLVTLYPRPVSAASSPYRIATYNILGSNHVNTGRLVGGSVNDRMKRVAAIVRGQGNGPRLDVVGMQEVMPDQYALLTSYLPRYSSFPTTGNSQQRIFWLSSRLQAVETGWLAYPGYPSENLDATSRSPWVKLQDRTTGSYFYLINQHAVAWNNKPGSDKGGAAKRERTAQILRTWVADKKLTGLPVFAVGDFNSAFYIRVYKKNFDIRKKDDIIEGQRSRLPYCILTSDNLLANAYDLEKGRTGCPTKYSPALEDLLDHIYVTPENVQVKNWKQIKRKKAVRASDHLPVYALVTITP